MTCREMDDLLIAGGDLPAAAREHLAGCEQCRALAGAMGDEAAYTLEPGLVERTSARIPLDFAAVKPLAPAQFYAALFLFVSLAIGGLIGWKKGLYGLPRLNGGQAAVIFGILGILFVLAAFALARDMRPGARSLAGGTIFLLGLGSIEAAFLGLFSDYHMGPFLHQGLGCFGLGMSCSMLTALAGWAALRRGYIVAPVSTGAVLGALAGLSGLTALELHCPVLLVPHLAIWHTAVFAASTGLGAAGGWFFRNRNLRPTTAA